MASAAPGHTTPPTRVNPHEKLAREQKARAIADSLVRAVQIQLTDVTALHALAGLVHKFTPEQRRFHERRAGVRPASDATWWRVAGLLCERAREVHP